MKEDIFNIPGAAPIISPSLEWQLDSTLKNPYWCYYSCDLDQLSGSRDLTDNLGMVSGKKMSHIETGSIYRPYLSW